jgi:hypothetical protein
VAHSGLIVNRRSSGVGDQRIREMQLATTSSQPVDEMWWAAPSRAERRYTHMTLLRRTGALIRATRVGGRGLLHLLQRWEEGCRPERGSRLRRGVRAIHHPPSTPHPDHQQSPPGCTLLRLLCACDAGVLSTREEAYVWEDKTAGRTLPFGRDWR